MNAPERVEAASADTRAGELALGLDAFVMALLAPDGGDDPEAQWLGTHRAAFEALGLTPADYVARWSRSPGQDDRRLHALAARLQLSPIEALALALCRAVETDAMCGRALAWLQSPAGGSRPTMGLLLSAACAFDPAPPAVQLAALTSGSASRTGVLQAERSARTTPETGLSTPLPLVLALSGLRPPWPGIPVGLDNPPALPPSLVEQAGQYARALRGKRRSLLIRSRHPREARAAAQLLAIAMGAEPAYLSDDPPPGCGVWLQLTARVPVWCCEPGPGERRSLPDLPGYDGPLLVATGLDGGFDDDGLPAPAWSIGVPTPDERVDLWQAATGDAALAQVLGYGHRHGAGRIHGLAQAGRIEASLAGAEAVTLADIVAAGRGGAAADLGALAEPLPDVIDDAALVLPAPLRAELDALVLRCSARDSLVDALGPAARARHRPGVRALLYGPSGTGKTLAVGWMASRLGLPLYRVDLANVTSKYIGETEKNLSQLFARAEHAEVVLMFDEADALFGKRTDVKDANDRYANAQTNYLLQRIESFEGIAILTSNSRGRFDSAFARRLDAIIEFPLPTPEDRRALWQAHLGPACGLSGADLNRLAAGCELAGGHIRNVVLAAASRARGSGRALAYEDLAYGVVLEYRKLGKKPPAGVV